MQARYITRFIGRNEEATFFLCFTFPLTLPADALLFVLYLYFGSNKCRICVRSILVSSDCCRTMVGDGPPLVGPPLFFPSGPLWVGPPLGTFGHDQVYTVEPP